MLSWILYLLFSFDVSQKRSTLRTDREKQAGKNGKVSIAQCPWVIQFISGYYGSLREHDIGKLLLRCDSVLEKFIANICKVILIIFCPFCGFICEDRKGMGERGDDTQQRATAEIHTLGLCAWDTCSINYAIAGPHFKYISDWKWSWSWTV